LDWPVSHTRTRTRTRTCTRTRTRSSILPYTGLPLLAGPPSRPFPKVRLPVK
jgi:hypothetical protein